MDVLTVRFVGADQGPWAVSAQHAVIGAPLPEVRALERVVGPGADPQGAGWTLRSFTSNLRYTTAHEAAAMAARQEGLGRPHAVCAALIPIRKSPDWWALGQDERREIYEERSRHTSIGMEYLPQIARKLHHCRDLGEPFDFLTWFEFAPADTARFDDLVGRLRATEEWRYVDREIDIRLNLA
ncbi:chlorite dismutase family protein [Sphingomonas sp.]|uniref:chlorite dismutase family protein n=1 Tax=Sphingomonas sp. TaxID=28214 RepID=UPI001D234A2D|nr:chlorite dismutase family protein [Sphingomonas sp.]MBX9795407.1 chlorite dismutase family protein [Sphingomonas sp.]